MIGLNCCTLFLSVYGQLGIWIETNIEWIFSLTIGNSLKVMKFDLRLKEDTQGSHHLMDMELADYQRAADTLQEKLNAVSSYHILCSKLL